jgi:sensor histidine kinase regulating citrate/malate metabolism
MTQDSLDARLAAESGQDPRGFGLWVCQQVASQFGGDFTALEPGEAATRLSVWIPQQGTS